MSIKAKVDTDGGITFEFDSDADLGTFLRAMKDGNIPVGGEQVSSVPQRDDETEQPLGERMKRFYKAVAVKEYQLKVLTELFNSQAGYKDTDLIKAVDLNNKNELGGVVAGISKTARPFGLTLDMLIHRRRLSASEGRAIRYMLTPMAREYLSAILEPRP